MHQERLSRSRRGIRVRFFPKAKLNLDEREQAPSSPLHVALRDGKVSDEFSRAHTNKLHRFPEPTFPEDTPGKDIPRPNWESAPGQNFN